MSSYEPHMVYTHKDQDEVTTVHVVWRETSGAICYVMEMDPLDANGMYALITPAGVTIYKTNNRIPAGSGEFLEGTSLTTQGPHHGDSIRIVPNITTGIGFNTITLGATYLLPGTLGQWCLRPVRAISHSREPAGLPRPGIHNLELLDAGEDLGASPPLTPLGRPRKTRTPLRKRPGAFGFIFKKRRLDFGATTPEILHQIDDIVMNQPCPATI